MFTTSVRDRFGLSREDLRRIQFFNSEEIVLQREAESRARGEQGGELVMRDALLVEQIRVAERTPCVVLRVEGDYLLMGFSAKDPRAALWFRAQRDDAVQRSGERRYELVALDNTLVERPPFEPRWSKGFLITWAGKQYHVVAGRSAYLEYDLDEDMERDTVRERAPGWRLAERPLPRMPDSEPPAAEPAAAPDAGFSYEEL